MKPLQREILTDKFAGRRSLRKFERKYSSRVFTDPANYWKERFKLSNTAHELEIFVDNFAGGGGASTGIEMAIGRSVEVAINHDPASIAMHKANHPRTKHFCESVWDEDPRVIANGRPVALVWLSPDCKYFSKAKGGTPVDKNIRGLAWVGVRWAATVRPRIIMLENVEEFKGWGPLILREDGQYYPDPKQKGRNFRSFVNALKRLGYDVEWRELKACDYGSPTTRKRLFLIARCDGLPIVWPDPVFADPESKEVKSGKLLPWRSAAEIIDWSRPCPSIFNRTKPLAKNTLRRIARGIQKFVLENDNPFIISEHKKFKTGFGGERLQRPLTVPLTTSTSKAEHLLICPILIQMGYGEANGQKPRVLNLKRPLGTITAGGNKFAIATAVITRQKERSMHYGESKSVTEFLKEYLTESTLFRSVESVDSRYAFLIKYYGNDDGQDCKSPLHTITTRARFGLVTIHGLNYEIVDIGMRMLEPRELFNGQGFPSGYIIDMMYNGKPYPKAQQIARCGNSVSPVIPAYLVRANLPEHCDVAA